MKYPTKIYAEALAESASVAKLADEPKIVENFLALVERNGNSSHLEKIVDEAARMLRKRIGMRKVTFESARPMNLAQKQALHTFAGIHDIVEEHVNPSLVAGVRIVIDDERQFDGSLAGKLDRLFG